MSATSLGVCSSWSYPAHGVTWPGKNVQGSRKQNAGANSKERGKTEDSKQNKCSGSQRECWNVINIIILSTTKLTVIGNNPTYNVLNK